MVYLSEPLRTWCWHPQKLEFNGDSNKLFSLRGPPFPHLSYQASTPNHCELLRPSASEFRSPRPENRSEHLYCQLFLPWVILFLSMAQKHWSGKVLESYQPKPSLAFLTSTYLKYPKLKKKIRNAEQKAASPHWEKPRKTRLLTWTVFQSKAEPAKLSPVILEKLPACICGSLSESALLKPRWLEWNIKYHSIDLMAVKSPSWAAGELLVCIPMHHCARKPVTINRCPTSW